MMGMGVILTLPLMVSVVATSSSSVNVRNNIRVRVNTRSVEEAKEVRVEARRTFKANLEAARELREQNREEFRERLAAIKDERKQQIVEHINGRLVSLNEKWVSQWNSALERLGSILDKVEEKGGDATKIAEARAAIEAAQEKVNAQAGKVYEMEFTGEENLGQTVREAIAKLKSDLRTVQESVKDARTAVVAAVRTMSRNLEGSNDEQ